MIKLVIKFLAVKLDNKKTYVSTIFTWASAVLGILSYAFPDTVPASMGMDIDSAIELFSGLFVTGGAAMTASMRHAIAKKESKNG